MTYRVSRSSGGGDGGGLERRRQAAPFDRLAQTLLLRCPVAALLALLLILTAPRPAAASEGDASWEFRTCVAGCQQTGCLPQELLPWNPNAGDPAAPPCHIACGPNIAAGYVPPLMLRLARWDCAADCSYHCMWAIEARRAAAKEGPVWKYVGKWPFIRVAGAQEMASVIFSIANLVAHVAGLRRFFAAVRAFSSSSGTAAAATGAAGAAAGSAAKQQQNGSSSSGGNSVYPYTWAWALYGAASVNAWVWSAVFHTRDTRFTERLDYFSADALVAAGLLVVAVRAARLTHPAAAAAPAAAVALGLASHVRYMAFVKFDYGYNMQVCIAAGITTAAAWVAWAAAARHPARRRLFAFVAAVHAAMALEVLDFPPIAGLMDAHALWHAATAPLTRLWYDFMVADVAWVCSGSSSGSSGSSSTGGAATAAADGGGSGGRGPSPGPGGGRRRQVAALADGPPGRREL